MPHTILLAEDHEDNRIALLSLLRHYGYQMIEATNGAEAVALTLEHRPDLVLMDLAMPLMDGREALRRIKADPATTRIPVVVLTAMALSLDREKLRAEGFDGFLTKPCMPPHLLDEVRRCLGAAPAAPISPAA